MAESSEEKGKQQPDPPPSETSLASRLPGSWRGYDRTATDKLLGELTSKHAALEGECDQLRAEVARLGAELDRHREREQVVSNTLLEASSHATRIRENAREEAETIVHKARARSEEHAALAERAERQRADAEGELDRLRQLTQEMQRGLTSFLTQTLAKLEPEAEPEPEPEAEAEAEPGAEPQPAGEAETGLDSALQAALKPGEDDARSPRDGSQAPPNQPAPPQQSGV